MDYKTKTSESYNQNAKELSEKFKDMMELNKRYEFQRFIDLLDGKKILDLGCGSGDHSLFFKEKGLDVVSIDLSRAMIDLCNEKGLDASLMDIENLDFEDKSFDGIWAVTSLLHIPKSRLDEVIKKLDMILKDDGVLYVCVKEGQGEKYISDKSYGTERFFAFFEEEEINKLFRKYFVLIENKKRKLNNTVFLQAFFKKR
ncbi:MAG: methyltransferase domain-containing protein [Nanohaloarchaea archaeon]|nr:methyltransferase domain-containing protein [Candidatus Nanohaloarchaea archaeon]